MGEHMTQEEEKILRSDSMMPINENPFNSGKDDSNKKKTGMGSKILGLFRRR